MAEISVSAAISFFEEVPKNLGKPVKLAFSTKSLSTDIATDSLKFSDQLVQQINQSYGTDTNTTTFNIDEFTRFVSGGKIKSFAGITDTSKKEIVETAFDEITGGGKTQATPSNLAEYLRVRDSKDGKVDGQAVINFLI